MTFGNSLSHFSERISGDEPKCVWEAAVFGGGKGERELDGKRAFGRSPSDRIRRHIG